MVFLSSGKESEEGTERTRLCCISSSFSLLARTSPDYYFFFLSEIMLNSHPFIAGKVIYLSRSIDPAWTISQRMG